MSNATPRHNHWLWSGPLVTLVGFVTYYVVFAKWAATRDVPWVNLPIVLAGAAMSVWGARLAFKRGGWRIAAGGLSTIFSAGLAALLAFYCFVLSYQLPAVTAASDTAAELPALTLTAHDGTAVALREASKDTLVLAFYRGAW